MAEAQATPQDAIALLESDHRTVEGLFEQFQNTDDSGQKSELAEQICQELIIHSMLEEEIFYPACRRGGDAEKLDEAQVEHDAVKVLVREIMHRSAGAPFYDAEVKVLSEYVKHHVQEEESQDGGVFAKAREAGLDLAGLGRKLAERKKELKEEAEAGDLEEPKTRALSVAIRQQQEETRMPRGSYRDRDEEGRFTSSRGGYGRGRDDEDYEGNGRSRSARYRERDEEGRFMSEGRSGRDEDYDEDYRGSRSRGRGRGGWFGDPEGHSEASREGWEHRGGARSRGRYEEEDEDYRGSRSRGRGHGGWFGDPEGHSEASREGWENRGRSRSRGRYEEEDEDYRGSRSRGGRGHGGWFGDPEGHSEAARRGRD